MFENAGHKIKTVAWVVFVAGIIVSVIQAISAAQVMEGWGEIRFSFWNFLLTLVIGILTSFVSALVLYAFGEITENTKRMAERAEETAEAVKAAAKAAKASDAAAPAPAPRVFRKVNISESWTCKKCGSRNEKGSLSCKDCGAYK